MNRGNEPAFPAPLEIKNQALGLTKREYFAAMAMQSFASLDGTWAVLSAFSETARNQKITQAAVSMADALLAELEKGA